MAPRTSSSNKLARDFSQPLGTDEINNVEPIEKKDTGVSKAVNECKGNVSSSSCVKKTDVKSDVKKSSNVLEEKVTGPEANKSDTEAMDVKQSIKSSANAKPQVSVLNFKLPLSIKRRISSGGQDEAEAKRVRIQSDGHELTVDCNIGRPKCKSCKITLTDPTALRYHNLMTHPDLLTSALVSPIKRPPDSSSSNLGEPHKQRHSLPNMMVEEGNSEEKEKRVKKVRVKVPREVIEDDDDDDRLMTDIANMKTCEDLPHLEVTRYTDLKAEQRLHKGKEDSSVSESLVQSQPPSVVSILTCILTKLVELDKESVFKEPVDIVDVPDYLSIVTQPMDFATMKQKIHLGAYETIEDFEADFRLVVNNCLIYNVETTIYYKAAKKMRDQGAKVIQEAKDGLRDSEDDEPEDITTPESLKTKNSNSKQSKKSKKVSKKSSRVMSSLDSEDSMEVSPSPDLPMEVSKTILTEASPSDSGVSTTAPDSDTSASSEFAVPDSVPQPRKGSKAPASKKKPLPSSSPTEGVGRRQSERRFGGEKPFGCNHCPLTFSNQLSKVAHERTHMEKPHECPFCEMRFLQELGLKRHARIHARQLGEPNTAIQA